MWKKEFFYGNKSFRTHYSNTIKPGFYFFPEFAMLKKKPFTNLWLKFDSFVPLAKKQGQNYDGHI